MRRFHYTKTDRHARFLEYFGWEFPASLEVITDLDRIDRLTAGDDVHMLQSNERLDVARPFDHGVLIVPCMAPGQPYAIGLKRDDLPFRITLKGRLQEAWEQLAQAPEWRRGVVGMHFRAMSGDIGPRMNPILIPDYEQRYQAIRDQYIERAQVIARQARIADPAFFVASEDRNFVSYVKERLPGAFSNVQQLSGSGNLSWQEYNATHRFDERVLIDVINDLWSLSFCDHLLHSPLSGYSQFALMNSPKLDLTKRHVVEVPTCEEIFDSLDPATAVEWTCAVVRKTDARRVEFDFPHLWLAKALERAGQPAEAALERQRAAWHSEVTSLAAVTMPGERIDWADVGHGQYERAIAIARRVAERLPANPYVLAGYRQSLSNLLAQTKDLDEATTWARRAIELDPGDPYLRAHLGDLLMRQKAFEEAELNLRAAISVEPGNPGFLDGLARCLADLGRLDEAITALRQAISLDPDNIKSLDRLNEVLLSSGRVTEAEAATRDAMLQRPDRAGLHQALARILEHQGRIDDALVEVRRAIELEPGQTRWNSWLAELLLRAGRFADAETALEKAVARETESAHLHHVLSIAFERQGKIEEAASASRRAADLNPLLPTRRLRVAELLFRAGKFEEAEAAVREAMSLHQADAAEYQLLCAALERQGRLDEASLAARAAAGIEPEQFNRHARAGELLFRAGRWEEAESSLKRAIELRDDHVNSHHLLSIVFERQDRLEEALAPARRAAEMEPGPFRDARVGELLMRAGRMDEAETMLRQVIERQPGVGLFHHLLSIGLERQGRTEEAVSEAQRASELEPAKDLWRARLASLVLHAAAERTARYAAEQSAQSAPEGSPRTVLGSSAGIAEAVIEEPPASSGASRGGIFRRGFWLRRGHA
jgi:tetratricopeptide (TPR) repeat protein